MKENPQKTIKEISPHLISEIDEDACEDICYHPECACRVRLIAGCSLPLAPAVQIINRKRAVDKGETGEK